MTAYGMALRQSSLLTTTSDLSSLAPTPLPTHPSAAFDSEEELRESMQQTSLSIAQAEEILDMARALQAKAP